MVRFSILTRALLVFFLACLSQQALAGTLNGTLFLFSGFAESDIQVRVEVIELDPNTNAGINQSFSDVTITANSGNVNYSVDFPDPASGSNFLVRYLCLARSCGRFVPEAYYTITGGTEFVFSGNTIIPNNQLPAIINFTLAIGNTASGTIIFPQQTTREIAINPAAQFVPDTVNTVFQQFFSNVPTVVPAGSTQAEYFVEGIPPILDAFFQPFADCPDCEAVGDFSRNALPPGFDPDNRIATARPTDQNNTGIQVNFEIGSNPLEPEPEPPASPTLSPIINLILNGESEGS